MESLPLAQCASRQRQDLLEVLERLNPNIAELTEHGSTFLEETALSG
jgi:hypothetical protein